MIRTLWNVFLLLVLATPAFPWGNEGHEMVARIAARNLTASSRKGIVGLLRSAPVDDLNLRALVGNSGDADPDDGAVEQALAMIATWPDHMPGGKAETAPWHFVDIGLFEGPSHLAERCGAGCVNQKIREIVQLLPSGKPLGRFTSDRQLRFLVHFLGDIHQPLHCATNADAGGNCERVTGFPGFTKLHGVWDTALVREVLSDGDDVEAAIIAEFTASLADFAKTTDPDQIAIESFELARTAVYGRAQPHIRLIHTFIDLRPNECATKAPVSIRNVRVKGPQSYDNEDSLKLVRQQIFKGGVRLATVLNQLFPQP